MTSITALLLFTAWTLTLMFSYVGYRTMLILARIKPANSWGRDKVAEDPAWVVRAQHAHLNCLESLPIFAVIVIAGMLLNRGAAVDAVAAFVLYARLGQSIAHLVGVTHWLVVIRGSFLLAQGALFAYLLWRLLA